MPFEIVARLLGRDRELRIVDQPLELGGGQGEAMGELAGGEVGEVGGRQALEEKARASRAHQQLARLAGHLESDLRPFRQLAHDVVDDVRRHGGRARLGDVGRRRFGRLEVEVGALQRQLAVARLDQHVGEDRDGVAPLDDAMDVAQSLEQGRSLYGDFHRSILDCRAAFCRRRAAFAQRVAAPRLSAPPYRAGRGLCQGVSRRARAGDARSPANRPKRRQRAGRLNAPLNRRL